MMKYGVSDLLTLTAVVAALFGLHQSPLHPFLWPPIISLVATVGTIAPVRRRSDPGLAMLVGWWSGLLTSFIAAGELVVYGGGWLGIVAFPLAMMIVAGAAIGGLIIGGIVGGAARLFVRNSLP